MKKLFFIISLFSIAGMFGMEHNQNIQEEEIAETSATPENLSVILQDKKTREALKKVDPQTLQTAIQEAECIARYKQREMNLEKQHQEREGQLSFAKTMLKISQQNHKDIEREIKSLKFTSQTTINNILELSRVAPREGLEEYERLSLEVGNMNKRYSEMPYYCKSLSYNSGKVLEFIFSGFN